MKKLVFMALSAVFMLSSGFLTVDFSNNLKASNNPDYLCHYSITRTTMHPGDYNVHKETRHFTTITNNELECRGAANLHLWGLQLGVIKW